MNYRVLMKMFLIFLFTHALTRLLLGFQFTGIDTNHINHHVYSKTAIWAALRLLYATDAIKMGVPIYFLIGDLCATEIHEYLDKAGIPEELRIRSPQTKKTHFITKLTGIFDEALSGFERFVVIDADTLAFKRGDPCPLFREIVERWDTSINRVLLPSAPHTVSRPPEWILTAIADRLGDINIFWERVASYQDKYSAKELRNRLLDEDIVIQPVGGWLVGYSREIRADDKFHEFISDLSEMAYADGAIIEMWMEISEEVAKIHCPPLVWRYEKLSDKSVLSHFYTSEGFDWREAWHADNAEVLAWATGREQ